MLLNVHEISHTKTHFMLIVVLVDDVSFHLKEFNNTIHDTNALSFISKPIL